MLEVIREEGETIDHLVRRYTDKLKRIHFFDTVKSKGFFNRKPNKRQVRASALYKEEKRQKIQYLKRIGKFPTTPMDVKYNARPRTTTE